MTYIFKVIKYIIICNLTIKMCVSVAKTKPGIRTHPESHRVMNLSPIKWFLKARLLDPYENQAEWTHEFML